MGLGGINTAAHSLVSPRRVDADWLLVSTYRAAHSRQLLASVASSSCYCGGRWFHKRRRLRILHHTVSYYSSRSLSLFWCMLAALLHFTSTRNSNNIDNQAKPQKKRYETGATTISCFCCIHLMFVCLRLTSAFHCTLFISRTFVTPR